MSAARLLRYWRRRADLTQRELARRAGTTQAAVARIETGRSDPRFGTLVRLLRTADRRITVTTKPVSHLDRTAMRQMLELTPAERLTRSAEEANNLEALLGDVRRAE